MRTRLRPRRARAGFSLVEIALALAVVVFCCFALFGLLEFGIGTSQNSSEKTVMSNLLTSVAADVRSTPNTTPKGGAAASLIFGIQLPASGAAAAGTPQTLYLDRNGQLATVSTARYQLNVWAQPPATTQQDTDVRLLLTFPARAPYADAQASVETVVALDRE